MDRNPCSARGCLGAPGRLPRGGRGSQPGACCECSQVTAVASREGGVDRNSLCGSKGLRTAGRLPRGGRGSQRYQPHEGGVRLGRLPRGGRGSQRRAYPAQVRGGRSPPARGAWIATTGARLRRRLTGVASREGGVDRNMTKVIGMTLDEGRLPRGGRGSQQRDAAHVHVPDGVASREGGVDRNMMSATIGLGMWGRLPRGGRGSQHARPGGLPCPSGVASREGGVDRNQRVMLPELGVSVASREGGVDRNAPWSRTIAVVSCRLPRGGRGSQRVVGGWCRSAAEGRLPRGGRGSQQLAPVQPDTGEGRLPRGGRGSQLRVELVRHLRGGRLPRGGRGSQHLGVDFVVGRLGRLPRGGRGSQPVGSLGSGRSGLVASREGGVDRNSLNSTGP